MPTCSAAFRLRPTSSARSSWTPPRSTVLGIRVREGKESEHLLYLSRTPEVTVTIPAGTTEPKQIWFYMLGDDFEDEELLSLLRREFSVKLLYADASSGITRLEDADDSVLHAEWVR